MHETEPNNDVTPPCPDCGEVAIPCECGKPIETVAQLQRALEAAGVEMCMWIDPGGKTWKCHVATDLDFDFATPAMVTGAGDSIALAASDALCKWWDRHG